MSPLAFLRNHPLMLAGVLVAAFVSWLAFDARTPPRPSDEDLTITLVPMQVAPVTEEVVPAREAIQREVFQPGVVTKDLISRLQPGMARVDVEGLIGVPPAGLVHPVSNVDGRFVYRASYLANLDSRRESTIPAPRSIIAIEFDASRPGHPLLKVHIPDPMS